MHIQYLFIAFIISILCSANTTYSQQIKQTNTQLVKRLQQADTVVLIDPPLYGFYSKYLNSEGIGIRSAQVVDNKALIIASSKIKRMLMHMPATLKSLAKTGVELHIIGRDQNTSDLPEFKLQKGKKYQDNSVTTDIDKRTRGMGGSVYASCGEENLLGLPGDRYVGGYDICMHEFAHTIMAIGFDSLLRNKIKNQFNKSIANGLWKGAYASSNPEEYWAELTMWFFGGHGDYIKGKLPLAGAKGLHDYDIGGYNLLDSIYSGMIQPKALEQKASVVVYEGVPSGESKVHAKLSVFNNKSQALKLYWIDEKGKAKFYETISAHTRIVQSTFISNVWMLKDQAGEALVYIKVNDPVCELELKD